MDDAVRVRERHGVADAQEELEALARADASVVERLVEPLTAHELHHVEHAPVGKRAGVVNRHDAGMLETAEDLRFRSQPRGRVAVVARRRRAP